MKNNKKFLIIFISLFSLFIFSCSSNDKQPTKEDMLMSEQQNQKYNQYTIIETENLDRYKIKRVAVLYDDTAYNYRRGIYEIVDTKTNKKYLGISGIGISELGNHSSGKTSTEDEQ